jgi:hypothetical protein
MTTQLIRHADVVWARPDNSLPFILVGSRKSANTELEVLKSLNITHILNVTEVVKNRHKSDDIKYMRIAIEDDKDVSIAPHLESAFSFINVCFIK